jgi:hypothetical protein
MSLRKKLRFFLVIIVLATCFNIVKFVPLAGSEGLIEQSRYPVVYVFPRNVSASLDEVFTISVIGFNFTDKKDPDTKVWLGNLYGFDIQFTWDPEVLQYVNHNVTVPAQDYPAPNPPSPYGGALNEPFLEVKSIVNESGGIPDADPRTRAEFSYVSMDPAKPFNGNCTFFTMTFRVKNDKKACVLEFVVGETGDFPQLSNVNGTSIYRKVYNGYYRAAAVPTADFTYQPSVAVLNKTTEFTALVSENVSKIDYYTWDFGDGVQQNTTVPTVTHVYNSTGDKTAALKVVDVNGFESAWASKTLKVVAFRDLKISEVKFPAPKIKMTPQALLTFNTFIENLGGSDENCTVYAYYNTTEVDPANPEAAGWNLINQTKILLSKATAGIPTSRALTFSLNTTLLAVNSSYYAFVKVTGIPSGYERNTTDNSRLSDKLIFVTNVDIHEISIVNFDCVWQSGKVLSFPPLIEGEDTTFRLTLANLGTGNDTAKATLYVDHVSVENFTISLNWGEQKIVPTWKETIAAGNHNLTIAVEVADFSTNSSISLRVMKPVQLQISITPSKIVINQTITFNASASIHKDPEGNITSWAWKFFEPDVSPTEGSPTETLSGPIVTYNFTSPGNWTVVLEVTDNFGLKYDERRPSTYSYMKEVKANVKASIQPPPEGGGIPFEYILAIVLVIVIIVAAAFVLHRRRGARKSGEA